MAQLIGALLPTLLISRLILWLGKKMRGGAYPDLIIAHAISLAISFVLAAFGNADGGPLNWMAGFTYLLPQLFWLIFDLVRKTKGKPPLFLGAEVITPR